MIENRFSSVVLPRLLRGDLLSNAQPVESGNSRHGASYGRVRQTLALIAARYGWRGRRWLEPLAPSQSLLQQWGSSNWLEYHAWLQRHTLSTEDEWWQLRSLSLHPPEQPRFSIITPVCDTEPAHLLECLLSVQMQSYPHWEHYLVDDASTRGESSRLLRTLAKADPRFHVLWLERKLGISEATNRALRMASGDYVVFLDHDDRLSFDALSRLAEAIEHNPGLDLLYTDRDMIAPDGSRFMHLMKPAWSPETLLSGNYIFHLVCYRTELVRSVGGLRRDMDGSQDYDLVLRVAEREPRVAHLPKVLYQWRQHAASVSLVHNSKPYIYAAGMAALREHLGRRGIPGQVDELSGLWRGNYRVTMPLPAAERIRHIELTEESAGELYMERVQHLLGEDPDWDYLVILDSRLSISAPRAVERLASFLQLPGVCMASGKIVNGANKLVHAGLVHRPSGIPLALYEGFPQGEPGYMGVTRILRNVSAPHPLCCALRRDVWERLGGFDGRFNGPHALLDLALRALEEGLGRCIYAPEAGFIAQNELRTTDSWPARDRARFADKWQAWLQRGDPYYSPVLSLTHSDMSLKED